MATSGLTMDFTLSGNGSDDAINLGSGVFTLGGTVTVNLSTINASLEAGTPYTLVSGTGNWSEANGTIFDFTTPWGYQVSSYTISSGTGANNNFSVEFEIVPEPLTWVMLLLGFGVLYRVRRVRA